MNQDLSFMLMLQRGVFEDLVRNTIVNACLPQLIMEEEVLWSGVPFQLLLLVSCFTVKSQLMLWNTGEYCRKTCFPQLKSCFLKGNNQIFQQDNAPAHAAKIRKMWFENKSIRLMFWSESIFEPYIWSHIKHKLTGKHFWLISHQRFETNNIEWNSIDSSFYKKLPISLPTRLKHLKKWETGKAIPYSVTLSMCLLLAYFLTHDLF